MIYILEKRGAYKSEKAFRFLMMHDKVPGQGVLELMISDFTEIIVHGIEIYNIKRVVLKGGRDEETGAIAEGMRARLDVAGRGKMPLLIVNNGDYNRIEGDYVFHIGEVLSLYLNHGRLEI